MKEGKKRLQNDLRDITFTILSSDILCAGNFCFFCITFDENLYFLYSLVLEYMVRLLLKQFFS